MGVGALVAAFVSASMTVRYDTSATVVLPERLDPSQLVAAANQTSFTGDDGQSLEVVAEVDSIRFVGSSSDPDLAARTANAAATAFVEGLGDSEVNLSTPASAPSEPASPRRLFNSLVGLGIGALVGLVLQAALRPSPIDDSVEYVPTWTSPDTLADSDSGSAPAAEPPSTEQPAPEDDLFAVSDTEFTPSTTSAFSSAAGAARPRPRAFQEAAGDAGEQPEAEPVWADDPPAADNATDSTDNTESTDSEGESVDRIAITIPGMPEDNDADPDGTATEVEHDAGTESAWSDEAYWGDDSFWGDDAQQAATPPGFDVPEDLTAPIERNTVEGDTGEQEAVEVEWADDAAADDDTAAAADEPAELDVPAPSLTVGRGFRDLVDRTSANLDPLIDRFAADSDDFENELDAVASGDATAADDAQLVDQIAFLGDEIATYQRRMDDERARHREERDELIAEHDEAIAALQAQLDDARLDLERVGERRDIARSQLEDRVSELEASLATSTDELERARRTANAASNRRTAAVEDLAAEIEFLKIEVERYQRTLDEERVTHSTAVAAARLENQDELDRIHREHRVTLNQLAQTNRNVLTAQRNEAEAVMAELEADHQRALDEAHADYEQRLTEARTHYSTQLTSLEDRTRSGLIAEQSAEIEDLKQRLEAALDDYRTSQRRTSELETEIATSDRRVEQVQLAHTQAERRLREEQRHLERRNEELSGLVTRAEERLADERRRTNDVVRNLLRESASAASAAEWARRSDNEVREEVETQHQAQLQLMQDQLRSLEQTAAQREASLEATIADLRRQLGASPNS